MPFYRLDVQPGCLSSAEGSPQWRYLHCQCSRRPRPSTWIAVNRIKIQSVRMSVSEFCVSEINLRFVTEIQQSHGRSWSTKTFPETCRPSGTSCWRLSLPLSEECTSSNFFYLRVEPSFYFCSFDVARYSIVVRAGRTVQLPTAKLPSSDLGQVVHTCPAPLKLGPHGAIEIWVILFTFNSL